MALHWIVNNSDDQDIIRQIIENRSLDDSFFQTNCDTLPDISLMKDIDKAADRIIQGLKAKEKIMIYGHDDLDGITSTYILYDFLEKIGSPNHYYYIPNRYLENHGIQKGLIQKVKQTGCSLTVTVDGGISSYEAVVELNKQDCDVIITDHHLVPPHLPPAYAIVNPKQIDCQYPFDMLAGVGVTYFLILKIAEKLEIDISNNYLLWTAIGSIADRVPLVEVNRSIVKRSLELWDAYNDDTLETFKHFFWKGDDVFSRLALIRQIIKIFNGGRLPDGEHKSLQALISIPQEKEKIISELMEIQTQHDENLNSAITKLYKLIPESVKTHWIFYDKDDILPYNTLGYCASVLTNEKMIPIVLLKKRNGDVVCEARCTDGFNLVDAFRYCKHHLLQFGGHKRAAGFVTKEEMIEGFEKAFEKYVHFHEREIINQKEMKIDAVIDFDKVEDKMMLRQLDFSPFLPFGEGNPEPILLLKNFLWERDSDSIPMRSDSPNLLNGEKYDIVVSYTGNFAMVRDYIKSGDNNES